jgi:hypothetical protein
MLTFILKYALNRMNSTSQGNFAKAESQTPRREVQSASSSDPRGEQHGKPGALLQKASFQETPTYCSHMQHTYSGAWTHSSFSYIFSFFFTAINIKLAMFIHHSTDSISGFSIQL